MNEETNAEILAELRSLRRYNAFGTFFVVLLGLICVAYVSWSVLERRPVPQRTPAMPANTFNSDDVWSRISAALDEGDEQKAVSIANDFVVRRPKYYYAYVVLGATYVATGDFTNAESSYVRAVQLYPDEENEGALAAVRKRLANDRANTK